MVHVRQRRHWPNSASRGRKAVEKLVGEHADDEGNSIWSSGEEVVTREEQSTTAIFGRRGTTVRGLVQRPWWSTRESGGSTRQGGPHGGNGGDGGWPERVVRLEALGVGASTVEVRTQGSPCSTGWRSSTP
jgi:hypothetical protein